ncbi:hypothetical protein [Neisseria sp. Dent CA1/247]|nr:hypothetical protein [Neisseria sp. Dent CA1/247]
MSMFQNGLRAADHLRPFDVEGKVGAARVADKMVFRPSEKL